MEKIEFLENILNLLWRNELLEEFSIQVDINHIYTITIENNFKQLKIKYDLNKNKILSLKVFYENN